MMAILTLVIKFTRARRDPTTKGGKCIIDRVQGFSSRWIQSWPRSTESMEHIVGELEIYVEMQGFPALSDHAFFCLPRTSQAT